jgi:hypothetical protein
MTCHSMSLLWGGSHALSLTWCFGHQMTCRHVTVCHCHGDTDLYSYLVRASQDAVHAIVESPQGHLFTTVGSVFIRCGADDRMLT